MFREDLPRAFCHTHMVALIWPDCQTDCASASCKIKATNRGRACEKPIVAMELEGSFKKCNVEEVGKLAHKSKLHRFLTSPQRRTTV
jgi:hypothetical protein